MARYTKAEAREWAREQMTGVCNVITGPSAETGAEPAGTGAVLLVEDNPDVASATTWDHAPSTPQLPAARTAS